MKDKIIEKYTKQYGTRFSKHAKRKFQKELLSDFEELGYSGEVNKKRVMLGSVENIYVGNVKNAKTAIVVPYNTPSKILWYKNDYYPQEGYANMKAMFIPTYVPIFLGYALLLAIIYALPLLLPKEWFNVAYIAAGMYLILFMVFMLRGFPNKKNVTNNSTSILAALKLAEGLDKQKRKEVLFIFTDGNKVNKANGNKPLMAYLEAKKKTSLQLISLFCLGQKDSIRLSYDKNTKGLSKDLIKQFKGTTNITSVSVLENEKYNSVVDGFQRSLMISSGEINQTGLKVKHIATAKDNTFDEVILTEVVEMLRSYIVNKK